MKELDEDLCCKVGGGFYTPFIWGALLGAVGYTVSNKYDFYINGLALAMIGGGITGSLDPLGALGKVLQVINVAITSEAVSYIQTQDF